MISILKITKGTNSAKRFILTIYKITKGDKTKKKCRRSNSSLSKSGHTFICTKFHEIISNGIKVIEQT